VDFAEEFVAAGGAEDVSGQKEKEGGGIADGGKVREERRRGLVLLEGGGVEVGESDGRRAGEGTELAGQTAAACGQRLMGFFVGGLFVFGGGLAGEETLAFVGCCC
jgi:hypothetical protein